MSVLLVVPTSRSFNPLDSIISGSLYEPPISIISPLEIITFFMLEEFFTVFKVINKAAALLLTKQTFSELSNKFIEEVKYSFLSPLLC